VCKARGNTCSSDEICGKFCALAAEASKKHSKKLVRVLKFPVMASALMAIK
jgi:hypothetical protein